MTASRQRRVTQCDWVVNWSGHVGQLQTLRDGGIVLVRTRPTNVGSRVQLLFTTRHVFVRQLGRESATISTRIASLGSPAHSGKRRRQRYRLSESTGSDVSAGTMGLPRCVGFQPRDLDVPAGRFDRCHHHPCRSIPILRQLQARARGFRPALDRRVRVRLCRLAASHACAHRSFQSSTMTTVRND